MTGLLLDTGAWAMAMTDDPRLAEPVRQRIGTARRVAVSAISVFEIGQKVRFGKWPEMAPFAVGLVDRALDDGFELLPLSPDAALQAAMLDWTHRDPFDRIIAATCLREDLGLVSPDAVFDTLALRRVWA